VLLPTLVHSLLDILDVFCVEHVNISLADQLVVVLAQVGQFHPFFLEVEHSCREKGLRIEEYLSLELHVFLLHKFDMNSPYLVLQTSDLFV
jgi:hypothetical protein